MGAGAPGRGAHRLGVPLALAARGRRAAVPRLRRPGGEPRSPPRDVGRGDTPYPAGDTARRLEPRRGAHACRGRWPATRPGPRTPPSRRTGAGRWPPACAADLTVLDRDLDGGRSGSDLAGARCCAPWSRGAMSSWRGAGREDAPGCSSCSRSPGVGRGDAEGAKATDQEAHWAQLRDEMVTTQIAARGVRDEDVLAALRTVPRHLFVPADVRAEAYADHPLPIGEGQTISQPYIVGLMTELLEVKPGDRVLEVGTGSGYQAAVLATIGCEVYTIEIREPLAREAEQRLESLGIKKRPRAGRRRLRRLARGGAVRRHHRHRGPRAHPAAAPRPAQGRWSHGDPGGSVLPAAQGDHPPRTRPSSPSATSSRSASSR